MLILFYRRQFRELNIVLTEGGDKYGREIDENVKINVIIFKLVNVWPSIPSPELHEREAAYSPSSYCKI